MPRTTHTLLTLACAGLLSAAPVQAMEHGDETGMKQQEGESEMQKSQMHETEKHEGKMEQAAGAPDLSETYQSGQLIGMDVRNNNDEELGEISQLIIDKTGNVTHVVLSSGGVLGVGGQGYVVPWDRVQLDTDQQRAQIDVSKSRLSSEFSAFEPLQERQDESEMELKQQEEGREMMKQRQEMEQ